VYIGYLLVRTKYHQISIKLSEGRNMEPAMSNLLHPKIAPNSPPQRVVIRQPLVLDAVAQRTSQPTVGVGWLAAAIAAGGLIA
jgi:hypothetical protein